MDVTGNNGRERTEKGRLALVTALFATLLLTAAVAASVGLGILFAWIVLQVFFRVVGSTSQPPAEPARPRLTLVATEAHASGD
jgi:hypothetical protein